MPDDCTKGLNRDEHGFDAPVALGHPIRSVLPDGHSAGPAVGESLPNLVLPDAHSRIIRFHEDEGAARFVVVRFELPRDCISKGNQYRTAWSRP